MESFDFSEERLDKPSALESEQLLLLTLQKDQERQLKKFGTYDTAIRQVSRHVIINDLTRASIAKPKARDHEGTLVETLVVRLTTPTQYTNNPSIIAPSEVPVPVANIKNNRILPLFSFSSFDADLMIEMLETVRFSRDQGLLPNISTDLGSIHAPRALPPLSPDTP